MCLKIWQCRQFPPAPYIMQGKVMFSVVCVNLSTWGWGVYPMMQWERTAFLHPKKNQPGRTGRKEGTSPTTTYCSPLQWNGEGIWELCASLWKAVLLRLHLHNDNIKPPRNCNCSTRLQPLHGQRDTSQPEQFTQVCVQRWHEQLR